VNIKYTKLLLLDLYTRYFRHLTAGKENTFVIIQRCYLNSLVHK